MSNAIPWMRVTGLCGALVNFVFKSSLTKVLKHELHCCMVSAHESLVLSFEPYKLRYSVTVVRAVSDGAFGQPYFLNVPSHIRLVFHCGWQSLHY